MCLQIWHPMISQFSIPDLKFSLLFFVLCEALCWLSSFNTVNPIRDTLLQIRRAMGLGELSLTDAKDRLDIALHGAEVSKLLQPRVQSYLAVLNGISREQDMVLKEINCIEQTLAQPISQDNADTCITLFDKAAAHAKNITKQLKSASEQINAFDMQTKIMETADERIEANIKPLRKIMEQQLEATKSKNALLEQSLYDCRQQYDTGYHATIFL